jgi:poly(3-hydroxybutyrate) depolymerase
MSRLRACLSIAVLMLTACHDSGTMPDLTGGEREHSSVANPVLVPLTPDARTILNGDWGQFNPGASDIWNDCFAGNTAGMNGSSYVIGTNCRYIVFDQYPRRYVVYVPANVRASSPVVVMLHGTGENGERFYHNSGWREQADSAGWMVVFPSSLPAFVIEDNAWRTKWNAFSADVVDTTQRPPMYPAGVEFPANDVGFISAVLDDLIANSSVDTRRLFVTGFSNGAGMGARLALELSDRIAAAGLFGAGFDLSTFVPGRPVPVMLVTGSRDDKTLNAINRLREPGADTIRSIPMDHITLFDLEFMASARDQWTTALNLDADAYHVRSVPHKLKMTWRKRKHGREEGSLLRMEIWENVTHVYPTDHTRHAGSNNPHDFDAAKVLARFFDSHWQRGTRAP